MLKRWEERTFYLLGQEIRLKIKAPSFDEAPAFMKKMAEFGVAAKEGKAAYDAGNAAAGADLFSLIDPAFARGLFEKNVKPVAETFAEDDDGEPKAIVTGLDVYGIANSVLVLSVLSAVQSLAVLSEPEGKGSGSPSTSAPGTGPGTIAGISPVMSIAPADGPAH